MDSKAEHLLYSRCWEDKARVSTPSHRCLVQQSINQSDTSSATIEQLKGTVDTLAFFYCKRNEENRRDRNKIFLSFIKQLALSY